MKLYGKSTSSGQLTIKSRAYFSINHLLGAYHFSKLAGEREEKFDGNITNDIIQRIYVINSILSATAFLEATINEFYQDAYDGDHNESGKLNQNVISLLSDFWEMTEKENKSPLSILDKYQMALLFARKEPFSKGENPYQDAALVVKVRNYLTHFKPMTLDENNKHPLESKLITRFDPNKMMEGSENNFFPDKALGVGCAEWSLKSVKNFADEFFQRMGIKPNYQVVDMDKLAGKK